MLGGGEARAPQTDLHWKGTLIVIRAHHICTVFMIPGRALQAPLLEWTCCMPPGASNLTWASYFFTFAKPRQDGSDEYNRERFTDKQIVTIATIQDNPAWHELRELSR